MYIVRNNRLRNSILVGNKVIASQTKCEFSKLDENTLKNLSKLKDISVEYIADADKELSGDKAVKSVKHNKKSNR